METRTASPSAKAHRPKNPSPLASIYGGVKHGPRTARRRGITSRAHPKSGLPPYGGARGPSYSRFPALPHLWPSVTPNLDYYKFLEARKNFAPEKQIGRRARRSRRAGSGDRERPSGRSITAGRRQTSPRSSSSRPPAQPALAKSEMTGGRVWGGQCVFPKTSALLSGVSRLSIAFPTHSCASPPRHCPELGGATSSLRWSRIPPTGNALWRAREGNMGRGRRRLYTTRPRYFRRLDEVAISRQSSSPRRAPRFYRVRTPINSRRFVAQ